MLRGSYYANDSGTFTMLPGSSVLGNKICLKVSIIVMTLIFTQKQTCMFNTARSIVEYILEKTGVSYQAYAGTGIGPHPATHASLALRGSVY